MFFRGLLDRRSSTTISPSSGGPIRGQDRANGTFDEVGGAELDQPLLAEGRQLFRRECQGHVPVRRLPEFVPRHGEDFAAPSKVGFVKAILEGDRDKLRHRATCWTLCRRGGLLLADSFEAGGQARGSHETLETFKLDTRTSLFFTFWLELRQTPEKKRRKV